MFRQSTVLAIIALIVAFIPTLAEAKRARCFTTDDGYFPCRFTSTSADGSFEISARGTPTYSLVMNQPGFAFGYINFGNHGTPISGEFVRQRDDPACWNNPDVNVKLCAW